MSYLECLPGGASRLAALLLPQIHSSILGRRALPAGRRAPESTLDMTRTVHQCTDYGVNIEGPALLAPALCDVRGRSANYVGRCELDFGQVSTFLATSVSAPCRRPA